LIRVSEKKSPDIDSYITADIATVSGHFQPSSLFIGGFEGIHPLHRWR